MMRPEEGFRAAMEGAGLTPPPEIVPDGRLHRFPSNGRRGDDAGWYVLHDDGGIPAGAFGCWRTGLEETWRADIGRALTPAEEAANRARIAEQREAREAADAKRHEDARVRVVTAWDNARPAPPDHPYLRSKDIGHHLARFDGRNLLIPVFVEGKISALQSISEDGEKRFTTGGRVQGGYCFLGAPTSKGDLVVCEGFATGATVREATKLAVVVAFNAGNLLAVAQAMRQRFPGARLILAADDDAATQGNPGLTKATEAARTVGGLLAVPDFGDTRPTGATDFNDLARHRGAEAVRACLARAVGPQATRASDPMPIPSPSGADAPSDGWPLPTPLPTGLPPVEPFRAELLPDALRGWIMDIAERTQCPADFAAVGAMVALGSVIGRKVGIRPKVRDDWQECANLWGVIVGPPSVLKSAALREAMAPLRQLEAKALSAFEAERVGWEAAKAAAEVKRRAAQQNATQRAKKGESFDADELVSHDAGEEPKPRRFIANDATPEALCEVLRANPNGILAYRDELAGLVRQLDREGMESARSFYLSAFSGSEPYVEDRIGRGTNLRIEAVCVSMLGTIQPAVVGELLQEAIRENGGDGFLSRFSLLAWPDVSANWKDVDRWPDSEARRQAFETFARLDAIDVTTIGATPEEGRPPFLRLSEPAREGFAEWRHELEHRLRDPEAEAPALVAHLGKYRKLVPSAALICHLADGGTGDVSEMALARALGWAEYLESHARRAYASVQQVQLDGARTLLRRIQRGDVPTPFTRRDVHNKGWSGLATADAVMAAAEILADYDWLRVETIASGGRPKTLYWINPRVQP